MIPVKHAQIGDVVQFNPLERDLFEREMPSSPTSEDWDWTAAVAFAKACNLYPPLRKSPWPWTVNVPMYGDSALSTLVLGCPWGKQYVKLYWDRNKEDLTSHFDLVALMSGPSETWQFRFEGLLVPVWFTKERLKTGGNGRNGWLFSKQLHLSLHNFNQLTAKGREPIDPRLSDMGTYLGTRDANGGDDGQGS